MNYVADIPSLLTVVCGLTRNMRNLLIFIYFTVDIGDIAKRVSVSIQQLTINYVGRPTPSITHYLNC